VNETIVIVPGIYTPRFVMMPLARRFRQQGYEPIIFRHRYLMQTPERNAQTLRLYIQQLGNSAVHLVGHSLGGLVILHLLSTEHKLPVKRVVLLGTPVHGSAVARKIHAKSWARWILGKSVVKALLHGAPHAQIKNEIGVLYGTARAGLSALLFQMDGVGDGVVLAAETQLNAATDRASIPHSHAIMLFSKVVADKTLLFIQTGQFLSDQHNSNQNTTSR